MGSTVYASPKLRVSSHDLTVNSTTLNFFFWFLITRQLLSIAVATVKSHDTMKCWAIYGTWRSLSQKRITVHGVGTGISLRISADMELGHWVTGSMGHLSRPGYRVIGSSFWPAVRPEFFRFSKKMPKMQNVHLKCWNDKSHCQVPDINILTYLLTLSSTPVLDKILDRVLEQ